MAASAEFDRNENVYKQVELQEAEERRLRDDELARIRLEWLEQMRVSALFPVVLGVKRKKKKTRLRFLEELHLFVFRHITCYYYYYY